MVNRARFFFSGGKRIVARLTVPEHTRLSARILLCLALIGIGVLLLSFAFSNMSLGRPITLAWVAAVAGLALLIPGVAVMGHAIISAFTGAKPESKQLNGPPPLKLT